MAVHAELTKSEHESLIDGGAARHAKGDLDGELQDYDEVIRLGYNPFYKGSNLKRAPVSIPDRSLCGVC